MTCRRLCFSRMRSRILKTHPLLKMTWRSHFCRTRKKSTSKKKICWQRSPLPCRWTPNIRLSRSSKSVWPAPSKPANHSKAPSQTSDPWNSIQAISTPKRNSSATSTTRKMIGGLSHLRPFLSPRNNCFGRWSELLSNSARLINMRTFCWGLVSCKILRG